MIQTDIYLLLFIRFGSFYSNIQSALIYKYVIRIRSDAQVIDTQL